MYSDKVISRKDGLYVASAGQRSQAMELALIFVALSFGDNNHTKQSHARTWRFRTGAAGCDLPE